jgi:hypothetical protein
MRTLVRDILEPVLERNEQEAEKYMTVERKVNAILKRLEIIEYSLNISTTAPSPMMQSPPKTFGDATKSHQPQTTSAILKSPTFALHSTIREESSSSEDSEGEGRKASEEPKEIPNVFQQLFDKISALVRIGRSSYFIEGGRK